jgi:hypothetical protein
MSDVGQERRERHVRLGQCLQQRPALIAPAAANGALGVGVGH